MNAKLKAIQKKIKALSKEDPDPPTQEFFVTLSGISDKEYFRDVLTKILEKRSDVTPEHLAYLIYAALQYCTDFSYDEHTEKERLESDLQKHSTKVIELCQTKNASTNVVERYVLMQIILVLLNKKAVVIDLGTSLGLGLMALNTDSFSHIDIDPPLQRYIKQKALISRAIGVDMQKPDLKWQKAVCYPGNLKDRPVLEQMYNKLKQEGTKIEFVQGNVLELDKIDLPKADVIWTSNFLYQIEGDVNKLMKNIRNLLKEKGIWINADYRYAEGKVFGGPENPYLAMVRRKEDWDTVLEVLEAPDDWVKSIKPGKDFEKFTRE